jgi:hypothetical protein
VNTGGVVVPGRPLVLDVVDVSLVVGVVVVVVSAGGGV